MVHIYIWRYQNEWRVGFSCKNLFVKLCKSGCIEEAAAAPELKILPVGFEQLLLVHPEHEEADEDEGAKEGEEVEAMSGEVEPLQISV